MRTDLVAEARAALESIDRIWWRGWNGSSGRVEAKRKAPSPQPLEPVAIEQRLVGDQRHRLGERLGEQHAVERVLVGAGDGAGLLRMANGDRELGEAFRRDFSRDVRCNRPGGRELADALLGRDLPCRRGTDMGLLGGAGDGVARRRGERRLDPVEPCAPRVRSARPNTLQHSWGLSAIDRCAIDPIPKGKRLAANAGR